MAQATERVPTPTERVSTRLTPQEFAEFVGLAEEMDRSIAWCVRQAVLEWMSAQPLSSSGQ